MRITKMWDRDRKWAVGKCPSVDLNNVWLSQTLDAKGREEGGGFRMGNAGITVADSFWYLAKLIQYCKV